jgi:hypothetical protein
LHRVRARQAFIAQGFRALARLTLLVEPVVTHEWSPAFPSVVPRDVRGKVGRGAAVGTARVTRVVVEEAPTTTPQAILAASSGTVFAHEARAFGLVSRVRTLATIRQPSGCKHPHCVKHANSVAPTYMWGEATTTPKTDAGARHVDGACGHTLVVQEVKAVAAPITRVPRRLPRTRVTLIALLTATRFPTQPSVPNLSCKTIDSDVAATTPKEFITVARCAESAAIAASMAARTTTLSGVATVVGAC